MDTTPTSLDSAPLIDPSDAQLIKPLAYLLLGVALAILALQRDKNAQGHVGTAPLYMFLSTLFFVYAVSEFLVGDLFLLDWSRSLAREMGWYRYHRLFQWGVISLCAAAGVLQYDRLHRLVAQTAATPIIQRLFKLGIVSFLVLYLLKSVSFHYTDMVLNQPLLGWAVSVYLDLLVFGLLLLCVVFIQVQKD